MPTKRSKSGATRQWRRPEPEEHITHHPIAVAGALAALTSVAVGFLSSFVVIFIVWLFAGHGDETTAQVVRASGIGWLGTQFVPIEIAGIPYGLMPWGFIVIPIVVLWKSMHWALKSAQPHTVRDYWFTAAALAGVYALIGMFISMFTSTNDLKTNAFRALVNTFVVAAMVAAASVLTYAPSKTLLIDPLPRMIVDGFRPGFIVSGFLVFLGALVSTVSLLVHFKEVKSVGTLMAPAALDGFFLMLLGIAYLPTAAIWALAYIIGPGISLGASATISPALTNPGRLPAFPLLAALPSTEFQYADKLIYVLIVIGIGLFFLLPREHWRPESAEFGYAITSAFRPRELVSLAISILVIFFSLIVVSVAAGGPLGLEQLSYVGPNPFLVAGRGAFVIGVAAYAALLLPRLAVATVYSLRHRKVSAQSISMKSAQDDN